MYIIPKEELDRIESQVKPVYLENINKLVEQGITSALGQIGTKLQFSDPQLEDWCQKIGNGLLNCKSDIYYKSITGALPYQLMEIYEKIKQNYNCTINMRSRRGNLFGNKGWNQARKEIELGKAKKFLEKCFPYSKFTSKDEEYDAYRYCKEMNFKVCVYCNAQLTHAVIRGRQKKIRPQIDHFFPQSRFPMFALSFYNIIPACQVCNYIKGDSYCELGTIYHPYMDSQADIRFIWHHNKLWVSYGSTIARNTAEMLHTEDIYNIYEGVAKKIVEKVQDYDAAYIEEIMDVMNKHRPKDEKLNKETVIRKIYDYVPREECFDTPLGELRHDILVDKLNKAYNMALAHKK